MVISLLSGSDASEDVQIESNDLTLCGVNNEDESCLIIGLFIKIKI